ncbi:DUF5678 domain-containing protein [Aerosakkonema sp. BLCC-F2]
MSEISVEELAKILNKDNEWLVDGYDELIQNYPGKMVAVENGQVVAVGDREVEEYCAARKQAQLVGPLLINVPHPDDLIPFII